MVANQEPKYAQAVFERLRETLDVVLTDSAMIACRDDFIQPNYDIREDGLWLRDCPVDLLNWTPVCDLGEDPGSPDPLTTPALPFPFTARQLAVFMLDGWGAFLAERFAGNDGEIDAETVKALLGAVRDAKPREAITAAFTALAEARKEVGEPDRKLNTAERKATTAYDKKRAEAERLHNWQEAGITEAERNARVQRRNEAVAAKKATYQRAKAANENAQVEWRRAMVRRLLEDMPDDPKGVAQPATRPGSKPATPESHESQERIQRRTDQGRKHLLTAVLNEARRTSLDQDDQNAVWATLVEMAQKPADQIQAPLVGIASGEGGQYRGKSFEANGEYDIYTKENLRSWLRRQPRSVAVGSGRNYRNSSVPRIAYASSSTSNEGQGDANITS